MDFIIVFAYILCSFGLTELLVYYDGFLHIFEYIREIASKIHPHIGELFTCVVCCSSWVGILLSALNFFFIPIDFTPFNIIMGDTGMWWFIIPLDMALTAGTTMILNHIDELIDKMTYYYDR